MLHSDFVHLHVHTQYSLLDGACLLPRLVDKAAKLKMPALAITDHGNIFGAIKFYSLCVKKGIKPIIGCECYMASASRFNKEFRSNEDTNYHIVLLAKDEEGYHNLIKLVSLGHTEGFYYKPRIDKEILTKYSKGLIGLSACLKGEVSSLILSGSIDRAQKAADQYLNIFGKGNFYLEIMENALDEQKIVNKQLLKISKDLDIPLVATNDIHYLDQEDAFAHQALLSIQTQTTLSDPKRFKFTGDSFYFRTPKEMKTIFNEIPVAIKNTLEVMQKCNLILDFTKTHLPHFPIPDNSNENDYLKKLCLEGLKKRYAMTTEVITKRLDYELGVIAKTGFASYFLIIWDLIKFSKESNIAVGPGRGSAAGSIVSYLLGITDIDPLRYDLLFERFLNPARISMPDIDMDFCYEKRSQVLDYVGQRYGRENVAQIITFGTMLARAVIRDVGRVMDFNYSEVDKIAKMIPAIPGRTVTLKEALSLSPELTEIYKTDNRIKQLIDVAARLEGLSRHASTHAAGVVISDKPLMDRIPLIRGAESELVTGFDMDSLEKSGMLKMDFLGLKTLTVIEEAIKIIKRTKNIDLDIANIPLDDQVSFDLLRDAGTVGVFQLESRGMREILRKIIPTRFEDLIAVLALYRPGPLGSGMVDDFIMRKHGKKKVEYLHPSLEDVLKGTYGIILYQEQTMQIVSHLAGFDMSRADLLRKAIGKKIPEIMEEQRGLFVEGCRKNKIPANIANQIFDLIDYFSGYGFNRSHSAAYAMISYRTAFLKANYPVEFMAALLTSERNNTDKVVEYINESSRMGIKVLPPDINTSYTNFTVTEDGNIRFGLMAIKNVGKAALESIIQVRTTGVFDDFFSFCDRVDSRTVNKKVVESLIKSGAMDSFGLKRAQMAAVLDKILAKNTKKIDINQMVLFKPPKENIIPDVDEWSLPQILDFEKSLLGIYVTAHPLCAYSNTVKYFNRSQIGSFYESSKSGDVLICGIIEKIKAITTRKSGKRMAILKLEDESGNVEVIIFPKLYEEASFMLREKAVVIINGKLESKEKIPKVLASQITVIEQAYGKVKKVDISIEQDKFPLDKLKKIFAINKGNIPVFFTFKKSKFHGVKIKTAQSFHLALNDRVLGEIGALIGEDNLSLTL
ncbi:MAG: DNA polymerase III subunit alpha [Candidatus Omnitrophica bacterium]|nr:DNA polymerase III subunit alpha [Candidatus Omnitrophota bacterium]